MTRGSRDPAAPGFSRRGPFVMSTATQPHPKLDEEAAAAYQEEARRHADALAAIRPGDADAVAEEFNRHMDRVQEILLSFARRCGALLLLSLPFFANDTTGACLSAM